MTKSNLRDAALDLGFFALGVCDARPAPHYDFYRQWVADGHHGTMSYLEHHAELRSDPRKLLPSCRSVIVVALNYNRPAPVQPGHPRIARYALGRDYHRVIRRKLKRLSKVLEVLAPGCESRVCVDSAPILEREFAQLAGIGWFGKNTCLIDSRRGSWFFLGVLLTSELLEPDEPAVGGCGNCTKCVDACPTGAIVFDRGRWMVDSPRCISYLTIEHRGAISTDLASSVGDWTFGCDICQEVCPFNQPRESQPLRGTQATDPDLLTSRPWPSLVDLARMEEPTWDRLTQGSAVRRATREGLKRNAEINLRNSPPL